MRAAQLTRLDGPDAVEVSEIDEPAGDGVVVEVHAAGAAFPDALLTRGLYQYKPDPPFVLGAEIAGVVRSAPDDAHVRPGDRVVGLTMLTGGMAGWRPRPLESGQGRALSAFDDVYRRPYEGTDNPAAAMQAYLDWEYGLVEQLKRDGTHGFVVI